MRLRRVRIRKRMVNDVTSQKIPQSWGSFGKSRKHPMVTKIAQSSCMVSTQQNFSRNLFTIVLLLLNINYSIQELPYVFYHTEWFYCRIADIPDNIAVFSSSNLALFRKNNLEEWFFCALAIGNTLFFQLLPVSLQWKKGIMHSFLSSFCTN